MCAQVGEQKEQKGSPGVRFPNSQTSPLEVDESSGEFGNLAGGRRRGTITRGRQTTGVREVLRCTENKSAPHTRGGYRLLEQPGVGAGPAVLPALNTSVPKDWPRQGTCYCFARLRQND